MKPIAELPLPDQAPFWGVVLGMAKEAGYSRDEFIRLTRKLWPHVKPPTSEELHEKRRETRQRYDWRQRLK